MNKLVCHNIYRAIREGRILKILYQNTKGEKTKFWIGIRDIDPEKRVLHVDGMHLAKCTTERYDNILIDSILEARLIEKAVYPVNEELVEDIEMYPDKYSSLFGNAVSLNVLNYLNECYILNQTPYLDKDRYLCADRIDVQILQDTPVYKLDEEQFAQTVRIMNEDDEDQKDSRLHVDLAMNVLSINSSRKGVYPLAYRKVYLDIMGHALRLDDHVTVCSELRAQSPDTGNDDRMNKKERLSIYYFLNEDEYHLIENYEENQKLIAETIAKNLEKRDGIIDEHPYFININREILVDFEVQYQGIIRSFEDGTLTLPLKAFLGLGTDEVVKRKPYSIALASKMADADQLLAIDNALTMPVSRIQGPPGTGKTNTIINTIITAFFNERTVLFASMNNKPINDVFQYLTSMTYDDTVIPFPVLRVGNEDETRKGIRKIRDFFSNVEYLTVQEKEIREFKKANTARTKGIEKKLSVAEERRKLLEKKDFLVNALAEESADKDTAKGYQRQLKAVEKALTKAETFTDEDVKGLLDYDEEKMMRFLYFISVRYIMKMKKKDFEDIYDIFCGDTDQAVKKLRDYIRNAEHLKKLQEIFPIIISTNMGSARLGGPQATFDLCIIDEAGQCDVATALLPIMRAGNLMLVGDPQQLKPVILMHKEDNDILRKKYGISEEYDYIKHSVYTCFSLLDTQGTEVLLHHHYRCNKKIVEFANQKYYNGQLEVCTVEDNESGLEALRYINIENSSTEQKNTSPSEVTVILDILEKYRNEFTDKELSLGIITPFRAQAEIVRDALSKEGIRNAEEMCGTVHAFQGDQKDVIILSTSITEQTQPGTYSWLKNNQELINVASTRPKKQLVVLTADDVLKELHNQSGTDDDDWYEFMQYVKSNGDASTVSPKMYPSAVFGSKTYNEEAEKNLLETVHLSLARIHKGKYADAYKEHVCPGQVFQGSARDIRNTWGESLQTVIFENNKPAIIIELSDVGDDKAGGAAKRLEKKKEYCEKQGIQLIQVPWNYARRYNMLRNSLNEILKE